MIWQRSYLLIGGAVVNLRSAVPCLMGVCWLTTATLFNADASSASASNPALNQQVEEVASRLEGVMDTSAQAAINSKAPNVRMTTCRIQVTDVASANADESIFLYQEQALSQDLSKPYRQRFLQLSPSLYSQSVRSRSFKPANPSAWTGLCNKPTADRTIQFKDLGNPVCNVFLKRSGNDYIGNTPIDGCPAKVRGAVRITNHIELRSIGMDTWDRGFDANGKQVWGARAESYQYRRINP
jgi:hypothetical protein